MRRKYNDLLAKRAGMLTEAETLLKDGKREDYKSKMAEIGNINDEIKALGKENFFHADYEATLVDTYGTDYEDSLVVEGGETSAQ